MKIARILKNCLLKACFLARLPAIFILKILFVARAPRPDKISRILVVRLDRMGDLVLSLPFLASLRSAYPDATIDILVRPYLADLAKMIKEVSGVAVCKGLFDAMRRLPGSGYDVAVDMLRDYPVKTALITLLSGAPVRIGFCGGFRELLFTHPVDGLIGSGKSMAELDLELLRPLGVKSVTGIPKLTAYGKKPADRPNIAIHPGAHYDSQRWDPKRFAAVARMAAEKYDVDVFVVGAAREKDLVARVVNCAGDGRVKPVFTDIKALVDALARSSLLVCNNSGPLHLAASLGVPTVSVMGPTDPILWSPIGEDQVVVRKDPGCSPCSLGRCRDHRCMDLVTAEEVFDKVRMLMEKRYGIKV